MLKFLKIQRLQWINVLHLYFHAIDMDDEILFLGYLWVDSIEEKQNYIA
jgi:hypothetical protein